MDSIRIVCDTIYAKTCSESAVAAAKSSGENILWTDVIHVALYMFAAIAVYLVLCLIFHKISKKWLASKKVLCQIIGAIFDFQWKWFIGLLVSLVIAASIPISFSNAIIVPCNKMWILTFIVWLVIKVCSTLTNIFNLRKEDIKITWCQIIILLAIGFWIIGFVFILRIQNENKGLVAFGIIGSLLTWIFQDKVKGVITFLHLRKHNLLNIGDWVVVPSLNVDGEVKRVSLTTVTIYNWDTTTSIIPISALSSGHFKNLQKMTEGKTYGRRMLRSFVFDTSWFQPLKSDEVENIIQKHPKVKDYLPSEEIKDVALNAHLYRIYLYHWLMGQSYISQQPRLIVRWEEQVNTGMPLQVYAYITEGSVVPFERKQSLITEHIVESMKWFNLKLYQSPSAYDASNSNIFMADKPATYREEVKL